MSEPLPLLSRSPASRPSPWRWIALLGLLLSPFIFVRCVEWQKNRAYARATACKMNLRNIGTALETYAEAHAGKFPAELSTLRPSFLQSVPVCPFTGADTYSSSYRHGDTVPYKQTESGRQVLYWVACHGDNHDFLERHTDFPAYNSAEGLLDGPP